MPLLDHFHPPLAERRPWEGVHGAWASTIAQQLNQVLPPHYVAIPLAKLGGRVEIDVATVEEKNGAGAGSKIAGNGGVATKTWSPPRPALRVPVDFTDQPVHEVRIFREEGGLQLVSAIELVSPANKDRPASRRAFALKCGAYLAQGASLVLVDVVTDRQANFHAELVQILQLALPWQSPTNLYAIAYRSHAENDQTHLEVWPEVLTVGSDLPRLPLWLDEDVSLPLDLQESYRVACEGLRIV